MDQVHKPHLCACLALDGTNGPRPNLPPADLERAATHCQDEWACNLELRAKRATTTLAVLSEHGSGTPAMLVRPPSTGRDRQPSHERQIPLRRCQVWRLAPYSPGCPIGSRGCRNGSEMFFSAWWAVALTCLPAHQNPQMGHLWVHFGSPNPEAPTTRGWGFRKIFIF